MLSTRLCYLKARKLSIYVGTEVFNFCKINAWALLIFRLCSSIESRFAIKLMFNESSGVKIGVEHASDDGKADSLTYNIESYKTFLPFVVALII